MADESVQSTEEVSIETSPNLSKSSKKDLDAGIIYLSRIPTLMNVKKIRQIFSAYGDIERIFLQPDEKAPAHRKNRSFKEGWVEFLDKRKAKRVANTLNNTQVGGKRRSPWYSELWNIKYLPKFKWGHLNERLAYERAVHQQRLRTEVSQAKKEANFYIANVERNKVMKRMEKKRKKIIRETEGEDTDEGQEGSSKQQMDDREWTFKQKDTEEEILSRKRRRTNAKQQKLKSKSGKSISHSTKIEGSAKQNSSGLKAAANKVFLKNLFSGGMVEEGEDI